MIELHCKCKKPRTQSSSNCPKIGALKVWSGLEAYFLFCLIRKWHFPLKTNKQMQSGNLFKRIFNKENHVRRAECIDKLVTSSQLRVAGLGFRLAKTSSSYRTQRMVSSIFYLPSCTTFTLTPRYIKPKPSNPICSKSRTSIQPLLAWLASNIHKHHSTCDSSRRRSSIHHQQYEFLIISSKQGLDNGSKCWSCGGL